MSWTVQTISALFCFNAQQSFFPNIFFFFNDTATTEIYTLSLHDALPIWRHGTDCPRSNPTATSSPPADRKSTRLNSSHMSISYAVFCLKKKKKTQYMLTFKLKKIESITIGNQNIIN